MSSGVSSLRENGILCALTVLFAGSILWINFHSAFWYDMDMALNARVAGLMWNEKTFFPENWVFGNSYFIIETPNLAALFYGLTHQTTLSMALASSLWMAIILGTFIWCLKPFVSKKGLSVGTLCLAGGIIFGTSAASYTKGLQVLYTMASYYACYLEVMLLTAGVWLRLVNGQKIHWALWTVVILLNIAVGMHSPRQILILGIPLLTLSLLLLLRKKERPSLSVILLALSVLLAELLGYLFIQRLGIPASDNIEPVRTEWSIDILAYHFINASKNLLRISGLAFIKEGVRCLPLFFCALAVVACVVWAIIDIARRKDGSSLPLFILLAWISVLAVFGVGVFLFPTRDIYYFIYWLLATLSVIYVIGQSRGKREGWLTGILCLIAVINYGYSFIPDFTDYRRYAPQMAETTEQLIDEGYTTLYSDDCAVFAAASKDRIAAAPIRLNPSESGDCPLSVFLYNKDLSLYDEAHIRHAAICLSNYYLDVEDEIPQFYWQRFHSATTPLRELRWGNRKIRLFLPAREEDLILPLSY